MFKTLLSLPWLFVTTFIDNWRYDSPTNTTKNPYLRRP
jgi:hypothetical protein